MQLRRSSDILLRIFVYLASNPERSPVSIQDLSEELAWNKNLVVKVAHLAVQQGWLAASRGRAGGLALAKPAGEYNLGEIVRFLEDDVPVINCDEPPCPLLAGGCRLRGALNKAREAFYCTLEDYTLADLVSSRTEESVVRFVGKKES